MLIYEKKDGETRKLFGTKEPVPSPSDNEVLVNGQTFDFQPGKYFYKAPGGIMDAEGQDVSVTLNGEQIIPQGVVNTPVVDDNDTSEDAEDVVDETKDELSELVDDNDTPDDPSDDKLLKSYTEEELNAMTKATILKMAEELGYTSIVSSMSKAEVVAAFLDAQTKDSRSNNK